jgi:hypothetical protein
MMEGGFLHGRLPFSCKKSKEEFLMKEFWNTFKLVFAAVGGWLGWFLGGCDGLLYALLALWSATTSPASCAQCDKKLSSAVGFRASAARC